MTALPQARDLYFTLHSRDKMRYYRLSESRVRRVIHSPGRIEEGVALGTIAFMQRTGSEKNPTELWVMVEDKKGTRRIISAWRYPGVTRPRSEITRKILKQKFSEFLDS